MKKFKIITYYLVAINIGIYLWMVFSGVSPFEPSGEELFSWGGSSSYSLANGQWWRLVTCTFLHSGVFHLLLNMYALCLVGPLLELTLGKTRLLIAYFSTGILASIASCLFHSDTPTVGVGASGAIFGLFGVLLALLTTRFFDKEDRDALIGSFGLTIGMNVLYSFRVGVDFAAHIGGLASGFLIGYCLYLMFVFRKKSLNLGIYFFIAILALGGSFFSIQHLKAKDSIVFFELQEQIASEHKEILQLLTPLSKKSEEEAILQLKEVIIPKSEKVKMLLKQMDSLRLTEDQIKRQQFLNKLLTLQIESFHLLAKSIEKNTSIYEPRLERINQLCAELVKQNQDDSKPKFPKN